MRERIDRWCQAIIAVTMISAASGAEWTVDAYAVADGDGSASRPFASIQLAVNLSHPGDTIWLRPGTYRQSVHVHGGGEVGAPLLIAGATEMPTLKGSLATSGWRHAWGSVWRLDNWPTASQQVFVDGRPLALSGPAIPLYDGLAPDGSAMIDARGRGTADLIPGSFCYVPGDRALYARMPLDDDPAGHLVEASVEQNVIDLIDAHDVIVRNVSVRHSSTGSYAVGGGAVELGTRCRMESCDVQWTDFCGIHLADGANGAAVVGCVVNNNGDTGIGADRHGGFLVQGCDVSWNNTRAFNSFWHAGGLKATNGSWGRIAGCRFQGNLGNGVWLDFCDSGNPLIVEGNDIEGNRGVAGSGVMVEGSSATRVSANLIADNDSRGVYVAASSDVLVCANTITGTRHGAAIDCSGTPRTGKRLAHIRLVDNLLVDNLGRDDLHLLRENGDDIVDLRVDHDLLWRAGGTVSIWWGSDGRAGWTGTSYDSLAGWSSASGLGSNCVQADPRLVGWAPSAGSPALARGERVDQVPTDYRDAPFTDPPTIGALQGSAALAQAWGQPTWASARASAAATGPSHGCGIASGVGLALISLALLARRR